MSSPEAWLKATIEAAASGATAWPLVPAESAPTPFVVYARSSTDRPIQMSGLTGFAEGVFSLEVCSDPWTSARAAADAIRAAIHNFTGTASGATIDHAFVTDERDGTPVYADGRDTPLYYVIDLTVSIRWQE